MSRVITFSRFFPATHPRKGEPTYFVEKIWESLWQQDLISLSKMVELSANTGVAQLNMNNIRSNKFEPKNHTIRSSNRWKVGDKFSPRVWSDKPYNSKMITIAPDIEIKKVWDILIFNVNGSLSFSINGKEQPSTIIGQLSKNDGLSLYDFSNWFNKTNIFSGQIICWNDSIEY